MPEIKIATERQMKKKYIKEQTEKEKKKSASRAGASSTANCSDSVPPT